MLCAYLDVIACDEEPVADEIQACYGGAEVNSGRVWEELNTRH